MLILILLYVNFFSSANAIEDKYSVYVGEIVEASGLASEVKHGPCEIEILKNGKESAVVLSHINAETNDEREYLTKRGVYYWWDKIKGYDLGYYKEEEEQVGRDLYITETNVRLKIKNDKIKYRKTLSQSIYNSFRSEQLSDFVCEASLID